MANGFLSKQAIMKNPLVSIIVPVYNTERYIRECLNSLIQQSYSHIEIIAVDDGSTDNSLCLLKELSVKDSRLKVFSQPNQGVSAARNLALSKATGTYVMFVDADDWIDLSTIEECLQAIKDADVCFLHTYESLAIARCLSYCSHKRSISQKKHVSNSSEE